MYISLNTVKTHTKAVYRKLGASSRSQAVDLARAQGRSAAIHPLRVGPGHQIRVSDKHEHDATGSRKSVAWTVLRLPANPELRPSKFQRPLTDRE